MKCLKKRKSKKLTQKEINKRFCKTGLNIEAIMHNAEKRILESGIAPGLAADISAHQRQKSKKRLFREEATFISR